VNIRVLFVLICLISCCRVSNAQFERETRAVWLATNFRLDWPPQTIDQSGQKDALIHILDDIKSKNLNTVYFQAESNGTVLFRSSFEPFSPYITGKIDDSTSYDPLHFAIEQAHKRGLEIHAWVNVFKCFNGTEINILKNPNHISQRKPEWVIEDLRDGQKSYWLDPGLPEVREYVSDVIEEMVERYDVDGVQLDYARYPGKNFEDDFSYRINGNGMNRDDWRRKNITDAVELINMKIKRIKPYVKLGAAPIGIYKNMKGIYGFEGFTDVYQDSRLWLSKGIIDYLAPQIYWGIDDNPRFDLLAREWAGGSAGRNIVLGIGAYKENVKADMERMIEYARAINVSGVAFYRYSNIKDYRFKSYPYKTYPAPMSWLDGINPDPPENLKCVKETSGKNIFILNWETINKRPVDDTTRYFALYSLPYRKSKSGPDQLFDLIPAGKKSITIEIEKPKRVNYYFMLKSVSKLWNESLESSNLIEIKFSELKSLAIADDFLSQPVLVKNNEGELRLLLYLTEKEKIEITGLKEHGSQLLISEYVPPGKNAISIDKDISSYKTLRVSLNNSRREYEIKF